MLTFILKNYWYDKIASGEKEIEYREVKPYWSKRLAKLFPDGLWADWEKAFADNNEKIGGAKASQHVLGTAADITVSGVSPSAVAAYAETLLPGAGGIGRYANFTHIDVREQKARWTG